VKPYRLVDIYTNVSEEFAVSMFGIFFYAKDGDSEFL
jgi:hypothetical protein